MIRRHFVMGAALGLAGAVPAWGQGKVVLKAGDTHPAGDASVEAMLQMGKRLEAQTDGRLSLQMFPTSQLGSERDMVEQAQVGALQVLRLSVGSAAALVDEFNLFNLPFMFRDVAHLQAVLDGPIGAELLELISTSPRAKLVGLGWMNAGARNVYNSKRPILSLDDMKGLKIRMFGNPQFVEAMNALGASGITIGNEQLYSALQNGVVDGAEGNPLTYVAQNHFQVAKHYALTEHLIVPELFVFSKRSWDTLSADDQALVRKLARETQLEQRQFWSKHEEQALAKMKAAGVEVTPIADKQRFQQAVRPVWEKHGSKYAELIKRVQAVP